MCNVKKVEYMQIKNKKKICYNKCLTILEVLKALPNNYLI